MANLNLTDEKPTESTPASQTDTEATQTPPNPPHADTDGVYAKFVRMSDVRHKSVQWLWPGRFAIGKLSMIAGDPGLGKSFLMLDMAARVSTGAGWPDAPGERIDPGDVVLLSAEDDVDDTIAPRLEAAEADASRIVAIESLCENKAEQQRVRPIDLGYDVKYVEAVLDTLPNPRLVIIDPVSAYMGQVDSHNNSETRAMLKKLSDLAAKRDVAVVCVSHLNKGVGRSAVYRVQGSIAFSAAARAVWCVSRDEHNPERRMFLPVKNNLAKDNNGMAYSLWDTPGSDHPRIGWEEGLIFDTADSALNPDSNDRPTALDAATEWLQQCLTPGPMRPAEVRTQAEEAGHSWATVERAKARAGAVSVQQHDGDKITGWAWQLKEDQE